MPTFECITRDERGMIRHEFLQAADTREVGEILRKSGSAIISVKQINQMVAKLRQFWANRQPSNNDIVFAERRMAMMLKNGIDLASTLTSLASQTSNVILRTKFQEIRESVMSGESMSNAFANHPDVFPPMAVGLTQAGEESGQLGECIDELASLGMRNLEVRSKVKSAFLYPIIVLTFALLIVIGFLVGVLPKFLQVFKSSGTELPTPTKVLLFISNCITTGWPVILIAVIAGVVLFRRFYKTEEGRKTVDRYWLSVPLFGRIILLSSLSRFCRTLGSLLKSGIPIDRALVIASTVTGNTYLEDLIAGCRDQVMKGATLSESLTDTEVIPELMLQMVGSGELSGSLDAMLEEVGEFYDLETTHAIRNLVTILEPAMLMLMGAIVLAMALSVLLPLFKMSQMYQ